MNRICTLALALFAGSFAFGETYTWTGAAGDGQWATPGNWAVGEASAEAAPGAADTAVFAANTAATVNFGETLTLGTIDLTAKGMDVVFTAADGAEVTVTTLNLGTVQSTSTGRTKITLDGVTMKAKNAVALNPGTFLKLDNAANLTVKKFDMYMAKLYTPEARTELHNGSTLTVTTTSGDVMRVCGTSVLLIDDSQVYCNGNFAIECAVSGVAPWGRVYFMGKHPLLKVTGAEFYSTGKLSTYYACGADFYFTIPEGGYEEPPIQHTNNSAGYFMRGSQSSQPPNSRLQVMFDSPAVQTREAFSQTLVSVGKAMDGTAKQEKTLLEGIKPEDAPTGEIAMSADKKSFVYTQHASAGIVTVSSAPFKFKDVDYTPVVDLAEGDTHTFTAPEHPAISADVTCTGYVIYDVDPVTLKRTKSSEGTGTTCNYTHGTGRREIEWQWEVPEVTVDTTGDDLQAAFDAYPCAKINLATGDYTRSSGCFTIQNAIWLAGVESNPGAAKLRISTSDAAKAIYVLVVSNDLAKVSNVLVSNKGSAAYGSNGAIWLWKGLVDGCVVTNCACAVGGGTRLGGGGSLRMEGGTVRNTLVTHCTHNRYCGGGISMLTADCLVENCRVHKCNAGSYANTFGGGIFASAGRVRNCLVTDCTAYQDGFGIYVGNATVENCTVVNCKSSNAATGGGIALGSKVYSGTSVGDGRPHGEVRNCIAVGCTNTSGSDDSDIVISYAAGVVENSDSILPVLDPVKGNISVDPAFDTDYSLKDRTLCVDGGQLLGWMGWTPDLAGNARVQGPAPDMGCFERAASTKLECWIDKVETLEGGVDAATVQLTAGVEGDATGAVYAWTVTDQSGSVLAATNGTDCAVVELTLDRAGDLTIALIVKKDQGEPAVASPVVYSIKASVVYLNAEGSDVQPYATRESGAHSLYDALAILKDGGEVLVAPGTYGLDDRVYLKAGQSAAIRSLEGSETVTFQMVMGKSGAPFGTDNKFPMFQLSASGARLEGVTLRGIWNGTSTGDSYLSPRAVLLEHDGAVVTNCHIHYFGGHARKVDGAGARVEKGTLTHSTIDHCAAFGGNGSGCYGGGVTQTGGLVDHCTILACQMSGAPDAQPAIPGGVVAQSGGQMRNCLITGCASGSMPIVYANGTLDNCTLVANTNTCTSSEITPSGKPVFPLQRVGLHVTGSGKAHNVLSVGNISTVLGETNLYTEAGATVENCFTAGNARFKKPVKGDWRLKQSSPCVDAGQWLEWMTPEATDLNGEPRVRLSGPDIGCYECQTQGFIILIDGKGGRVPPPEETQGGEEPPDDSGQASTDPTTDPTEDPSQPGGGSGSSSEEPETPSEPETPEEPETGIVIPHRGETVPTLARVEGLSDLEQSLYETTVAEFDAVNPIDEATGKRKYISFGFATDEHSCKRVEGDDAAKDPVKDYWYYFGSSLTKCDHSIRLLGAVAGNVGLDAVFNGGDFSTGNSLTALTDEEYLAQISYVKSQFAQYLPTTPFFTVDGNHDRNYAPNATYGTLGHQWNDAQWRTALELFNSDVSQNPDVQVTMHRDLAHPTVGSANPGTYTGNSYHVDCTRLMAQGKPNVRFVCVSEYDSTPGNGTLLRMYDGFQFYDPVTKELIDPTKTPDNTLICIISHGNMGNPLGMALSLYLNAGNRKGNSTQQAQLNSNLGQHKGLGFIGSVAGHAHQTLVKPIDDNWKSSCVQVRECYAVHNSTAASGYRFSIFTVDTDRRKLYETRVVDGTATNYATEIDWATN